MVCHVEWSSYSAPGPHVFHLPKEPGNEVPRPPATTINVGSGNPIKFTKQFIILEEFCVTNILALCNSLSQGARTSGQPKKKITKLVIK